MERRHYIYNHACAKKYQTLDIKHKYYTRASMHNNSTSSKINVPDSVLFYALGFMFVPHCL